MAAYQLIIIGGGLSGLAAGIRAARFGYKTLILEQHGLPGGLNSFYTRQGRLFETGLHAMTNCAAPRDKHAPLNRLFRQLHLSRKQFNFHEQIASEIRFPERHLRFTNDPAVLEAEIACCFPARIDAFCRLKEHIAAYDPFAVVPWRSARSFLHTQLQEPALEEMLLLPLMVYGNAEEQDMDLGQFVIMFRAVFEEGFFRPDTTMREFLALLVDQYRDFGGELRYHSPAARITTREGKVSGVCLENGEVLEADTVLSTAGVPETIRLSGWSADPHAYSGRMSFMETISVLPADKIAALGWEQTIIFYNTRSALQYRRPDDFLDTSWGVICFPEHFSGLPACETGQIRVTNPASYPLWKGLTPADYVNQKQRFTRMATKASEEIIGNYQPSIVYQDSFTPVTIERFTRKAEGAVYGSSRKIKDGRTPWPNLFVAGTDQGYLGIVGAMLSGITVVNQHILR
ncbi:MAG: FAD-dependent oxidoreductase [Desulfobulbus sp.]|nr:FAD-dependent oxidoreductase [Desulfobulbus sp.]